MIIIMVIIMVIIIAIIIAVIMILMFLAQVPSRFVSIIAKVPIDSRVK